MVWSDLLTARYNIAFDHNTLYEMTDLTGHQTAVKDFFYDTYLLLVFFTGI